MKIENDPMTRTISYHPILVESNEDKIILNYVMWIGLGAHESLDQEHLGRYMLQKNQPDRTDEVVESGIKKWVNTNSKKHQLKYKNNALNYKSVLYKCLH